MQDESKPNQLPEAFSFDADPNPRLRRYEETRASKWKPKTENGLKEISGLAVFLRSLERWPEAGQIGELVRMNCRFQGDFEIWTWAHLTLTLASYAMRRMDRREEADAFHQSAHPLPIYMTGLNFIPLSRWERDFPAQYGSSARLHLVRFIRPNIGVLESAVRGIPTGPLKLPRAEADVREALSRLRSILEKEKQGKEQGKPESSV